MTGLPVGWTSVGLDEVCELIPGQSPPGSTYNVRGEGLPFYQGKAEFGTLRPTPVKWCSAPVRIAEADDVLISVRAPVGPTNLCPERSCIGRGLAAIRPRGAIPPRYVLYALRAVESRLALMGSGSTFSAISVGALRSFDIPLAPLTEQCRIVAAIEEHLSRLDAAIAGLKRVQAQLPRYRAAVLKAAVEGQFCGPQPRSWHNTTLGDVLCSLGNGISKKPSEDSGQAILRISAVREMSVDTSDVRYLPISDSWQRYLLEPGDLLFTRYNGNPRFVGVCGMVPEQAGCLAYPDKLIRARVDRSSALPAFVQIAVSTGRSRAFLQSRVRTTAGQAGISGSDLRQVPLALPSLEVQERIVDEVERQLSHAESLAHVLGGALSRAQWLRQSLCRRAFEGKLVPQDPNDEPASVLLERIRAARAAAPTRPGRPRRARPV